MLLILNSLSMIILTLIKPSGPFCASAGLKFILWMVAEEKKPWTATENPFLDKWMPTETAENAGLKTCLMSGCCILMTNSVPRVSETGHNCPPGYLYPILVSAALSDLRHTPSNLQQAGRQSAQAHCGQRPPLPSCTLFLRKQPISDPGSDQWEARKSRPG